MPPLPEQQDFYADPLIYDVLHRSGTAGEVRTLLRIAERHLNERGGRGRRESLSSSSLRSLCFLEPACGTGRYLFELARHGHKTVGFDLSADMVRYADARAQTLQLRPRPRLFVADMTDFRVQSRSVDVAFNLINTIRHLRSDRAMLDHFACIGRALKSDGLYLVGLEVAEPSWSQPTEDVWQGRGEGVRVQQVVSYVPPEGRGRGEGIFSHLTVTTGRGKAKVERHIDSRYTLRTYTRGQWDALLKRAGLKVAGIYGPTGRTKRDDQAAHGYFLWVLKKG